MRDRWTSVLCGLLLVLPCARSIAQRTLTVEPGSSPAVGSLFEPITLRHDGWYFARVSERTPRAMIEDAALSRRIRGSSPAGEAVEVLWEGPGSGLIIQGRDDYRAWQPRSVPAATWRHSVWFNHGGRSRVDRTWWSWYDSTAEAGTRGVVVLIPGMLGTPEPTIEMLILGLRGRGWGVMRMLAHPSGYTENHLVRTADRTPDEIADEFATNMQPRMLAMLETVRAALREVAHQPGPRVLISMSGGTLATPAILAELLEDEARRDSAPSFKAAVLIGAGADVLTMSETSAYAGFLGGLQLDWAGAEYDPAVLAGAALSHRRLSTLGPYWMAPKVRDVKLLLVQGEKDQAVPARLGDMLWERLGKPERWSAPVGHELLFLGYVPMRASALLDWIDDAVNPETESESP